MWREEVINDNGRIIVVKNRLVLAETQPQSISVASIGPKRMYFLKRAEVRNSRTLKWLLHEWGCEYFRSGAAAREPCVLYQHSFTLALGRSAFYFHKWKGMREPATCLSPVLFGFVLFLLSFLFSQIQSCGRFASQICIISCLGYEPWKRGHQFWWELLTIPAKHIETVACLFTYNKQSRTSRSAWNGKH